MVAREQRVQLVSQDLQVPEERGDLQEDQENR